MYITGRNVVGWMLWASTQTAMIRTTWACTNLLVTPSASATGDAMIAYNADSGNLMGQLYHYPATSSSGNEVKEVEKMRKVWNWDTAEYLGEIPEAPETFNVVGNTNEHGLVIAETTFGGIDILADPKYQPDAKIDYGSLIWITLQRSKTVREAILTMADLMDTHGYASEGESFSLADRQGEVWIMEVIGRGEGKVGAVWVAMKVPDGMIAAHSNQARIQTFPRNDPENCLYSHDVVDLAKEIGVYESPKDDPEDLKFSFSDVYNPITFMGARASDARTWAIFSMLAEDETFEETYENYAMGKNWDDDETPLKRMPLWIKPKKRLTYDDVSSAMSNHYEGTKMAFDKDVGAGPYEAPYRARPLAWKYNDVRYHNERAVGTQQTGWNFIAQIRLNMPPPVATILWFAVDDSSTSPRFPVYGGSTDVSAAYGGKGTQDGVPSPLLEFDIGKAFWVQNMVSNLAYTRWSSAYPLIVDRRKTIHDGFEDEIVYLDQQMMAIMDQNIDNAVEEVVRLATAFSIQSGDRLHKEWFQFYGELFARLRDFFVVEEDPDDPICNCKVKEVGYDDKWKARIVEETGSHYECEDKDSVPDLVSVEKKLRGSVIANALGVI